MWQALPTDSFLSMVYKRTSCACSSLTQEHMIRPSPVLYTFHTDSCRAFVEGGMKLSSWGCGVISRYSHSPPKHRHTCAQETPGNSSDFSRQQRAGEHSRLWRKSLDGFTQETGGSHPWWRRGIETVFAVLPSLLALTVAQGWHPRVASSVVVVVLVVVAVAVVAVAVVVVL